MTTLLDQISKGELAFQGYVMSDWGAHHLTTLAAGADLDTSMLGDITFFSGATRGLVGHELHCICREWHDRGGGRGRCGGAHRRRVVPPRPGSNYPDVNFNGWLPNDPATNSHVDVQSDHFKVVREVGAASTVHLKNIASTLPLLKPRSIAIVGNDSGPSTCGPNGYLLQTGDGGTPAMGWGSGAGSFPTSSRSSKLSSTTALGQDVVLVFANADSGEDAFTVNGIEGDRKNLTLWGNADDLINAISTVNPNTIVVVHTVGPVILKTWIGRQNVTAVLWAGLPGQESGNALVDMLYGVVNTSVRLPYTIAKSAAECPA
ncbi:hypothetical protein V8D89_006744 [Ganoderma adspersum]